MICSPDRAAKNAHHWRAVEGSLVGFTNGCFDVIHPGHQFLLDYCRQFCRRLIVGLNSDTSVRRLKGHGRPVNDELTRAQNLLATRKVDAIVIFGDDTPERLIKMLVPDALIKGGDYMRDQVVGADFVEKRGGKVLLAPYIEGHSTTAIIEGVKR